MHKEYQSSSSMSAQSRGRSAVFSHSRSAPDLPPLGSFSITPASTPEEQTPRALRGSEPPPPAFLIDGEEEDDEADEADFHSHYALDAPSDSDSSTSNSGSEGAPDDPMNRPRPYLHHSNSSLLSAHAFVPPFYNKPPTPLPPSPSLTSLLRPSFSATTSRPTTPDSSENDTPNDTEAAVAKSARTATTVPRASPKVPTYEYYGFVLYLISSLAFRTSSPTVLPLPLPLILASGLPLVVLSAIALPSSARHSLLPEPLVVVGDPVLPRHDACIHLCSARGLQHRIPHPSNE